MTKEDLKTAKYFVKHDGRVYEIDHITKCYVFFKTLLPGKDYLGHPHYKLNKKGLCQVPIHFVMESVENGKYTLK